MAALEHVSVYGEPGVYAGWPANHGAWQWGDEFLVGFIRGMHNVGGMHNVMGRLEKVQARSMDGGETWSVEIPNVDFECRKAEPPPEFSLSTSIVRVSGGYDHGGENCIPEGGFYLSSDRGRTWRGAYSFKGLDLPPSLKNTSRTCVLGEIVFLSAAQKRAWGSDFTFCATYDGSKFVGKSVVCNDDCRAVMPAAAKLGDRIVVAVRRRGPSRAGGWIDAFHSDDGGESWSKGFHVAETGKDNGNPPSLIEAGGKLYCATANRSEGTIDVMVSEDGERWLGHLMLRKSNAPDIGYPRLFKRSDGNLVCIYYWTEEFDKAQRIEATIFDPKG